MHIFQVFLKKVFLLLYLTELQSDLFSTCHKLSPSAEELVVHYKQTIFYYLISIKWDNTSEYEIIQSNIPPTLLDELSTFFFPSFVPFSRMQHRRQTTSSLTIILVSQKVLINNHIKFGYWFAKYWTAGWSQNIIESHFP